MSGGDRMDHILDCVVQGARGFLLLCPSWPVLKTDATWDPK
jgi:hypothetical protein